MIVSLSAALERRGHTPLVARTAQDGLALLDAHGAALVVLALPLPDMTARPLLQRLRGHAIIVTGSDDDVKTPDRRARSGRSRLSRRNRHRSGGVSRDRRRGAGLAPRGSTSALSARARSLGHRLAGDRRGLPGLETGGRDPAPGLPPHFGRRHAHHLAQRGNRHRQGLRGQVRPLQRRPTQPAVRRGQLRRAAWNPDGIGALRLRARRVHRRQDGSARLVRDRERRHAVSRRDRRRAARSAGQAAHRDRGEAGPPHRRQTVDARQRADHRRHARRPADTRSNLGEFRSDLFHRINVVTVMLPALRERGEDIVLLAEAFVRSICREYGIPERRLAPDAQAWMLRYGWPGNVRELRNQIERIVLLENDEFIRAEHFRAAQADGRKVAITQTNGKLRISLPPTGVPLEAHRARGDPRGARALRRQRLSRCSLSLDHAPDADLSNEEARPGRQRPRSHRPAELDGTEEEPPSPPAFVFSAWPTPAPPDRNGKRPVRRANRGQELRRRHRLRPHDSGRARDRRQRARLEHPEVRRARRNRLSPHHRRLEPTGHRNRRRDVGPPINDFESALRDGWTDGSPIEPMKLLRRRGIGAGLGAVARLSDGLNYERTPHGKVITARRYVRRMASLRPGKRGR